MVFGGNHVGQVSHRNPRCVVVGVVGDEDLHLVGGVVGAGPCRAYHREYHVLAGFVEVHLQVVVHTAGQRVVPRRVEDDAAVVVARVDELCFVELLALHRVGIELRGIGDEGVVGLDDVGEGRVVHLASRLSEAGKHSAQGALFLTLGELLDVVLVVNTAQVPQAEVKCSVLPLADEALLAGTRVVSGSVVGFVVVEVRDVPFAGALAGEQLGHAGRGARGHSGGGGFLVGDVLAGVEVADGEVVVLVLDAEDEALVALVELLPAQRVGVVNEHGFLFVLRVEEAVVAVHDVVEAVGHGVDALHHRLEGSRQGCFGRTATFGIARCHSLLGFRKCTLVSLYERLLVESGVGTRGEFVAAQVIERHLQQLYRIVNLDGGIHLEAGEAEEDVAVVVVAVVHGSLHHEADVGVLGAEIDARRGVERRMHVVHVFGNHVGQFSHRNPRQLVLGVVGNKNLHLVGGVVGSHPVGAYHREDEVFAGLVEVHLQVVENAFGQRVAPRGVEDDVGVVVTRVDEPFHIELLTLHRVCVELRGVCDESLFGVEGPNVIFSPGSTESHQYCRQTKQT